jgi:hypothetical protein
MLLWCRTIIDCIELYRVVYSDTVLLSYVHSWFKCQQYLRGILANIKWKMCSVDSKKKKEEEEKQ